MQVSRVTNNQRALQSRCHQTVPIPSINDLIVDHSGMRHEVLFVSEAEGSALIQAPDGNKRETTLVDIADWSNLGRWEI